MSKPIVHRIKIIFYHSIVDYTFCNLIELQNVINNVKQINRSSSYVPKITIIGNEYWLKFDLNNDKDYEQMESKLANAYQLK